MSSPTLFRSWKPSRLAANLKTSIVEAARATTAAPSFFSSIDIIGDEGLKERFIDGGLLVKNPAQSVLDQAKELFPDSHIDYVPSLGSGMPSVIRTHVHNSIFKMLLPTNSSLMKTSIKIATDCEYTAEETGRKFADKPGIYYHLNVDRGMEEVTLSEWIKMDVVRIHTSDILNEEMFGKRR